MLSSVAPTRSSIFYAYLITKIGNRNPEDVRGCQFSTMKAAETLCIVCLPLEEHIS